MRVSWDGNGAVDERADKCPDESRYGLRPSPHNLQAEGQAVDVWAVVRDDAQCQYDQAELAEAAEGRKKDGCQQSTDARFVVSVGVRHVDRIEGRCGDCKAKHFGEAEWEYQATPGPGESLDSTDCVRLIYGIIRCVTGPSCSKPKDRGSE